MKRKALIALLGIGTIFGFSTGFASMSHHWHHRAEQRRAAWEAHVADVCVEAAQRADRAERTDRWGPPPRDYPAWDEPREQEPHRRHHHRHHDRW